MAAFGGGGFLLVGGGGGEVVCRQFPLLVEFESLPFVGRDTRNSGEGFGGLL